MTTRRDFLRLGAASLLAASAPGLSFAASPTDARLVVVLLRGALDGLAAVPPFGDPSHASVRGSAAVTEGVVPLDGTFGLHPALAPLLPLWQAGELGVVHAVGNPYLDRSHFDAQNCLENGTSEPFSTRDGWLNRALVRAGGGEPAVAVGRSLPLLLQGPSSATSLDPLRRWAPDEAFVAEVAELYRSDPALGPALAQALEAQAMLEAHRSLSKVAAGNDLARAASVMGGVLGSADGPRVAVFEAGGWDTHANQAGALTRQLGGLADGMLALKAGLGTAWSSTVVLVLTEFGRTVGANGTKGTDHGTGSAAFLLGGRVAGGVHGRWPGLDKLFEDRDLAPANDVRGLLKGVLAGHLGLGEGALEDEVFPGSREAPAMEGLLRA